MSTKFHYQCTNCNKTFAENEVLYLCPHCSVSNSEKLPPKGVLKVIYNYPQPGEPESCSLSSPIMKFEELKMNQFIDLLPINQMGNWPKLHIGDTPLYKFDGFEGTKIPFELHLKEDSQNPTYSFKDRASALVSAYAKENKITTLITASTGNAGSSLAGICASQGQKAIILVPETAPLAKLTQIMMYGATLIPVKGTYDEAFDLSVKASTLFGWYNRNTAYNPLTIEGKKTVAFELFEQLDYTIPDKVFVPVGDGVIISGIYKGFEDLLQLGIISKIPVIVAIQSENSNNLIRNINNSKFQIIKSNTIADSISVDIPRNFYMAQQFINKYGGEMLGVSDFEIIEASKQLAKNTGLFTEPAAAAAFAGFIRYLESHKIKQHSKNIVLLTGSGLKDLNTVNQALKRPESIYPEIDLLAKKMKM